MYRMTFQFLYTAVILTAVLSVAAQPIDRIGELEAVIAAEMEATKTPGAAVAILRGDKVVYAKGFGTTSVEGGGSPVTAGELEKFTGRFVHAPQTWEIRTRDGKLFVETEGKEFELKKTGLNEFSCEQGQILFVANQNGAFGHIFMGLCAARRV